MPNTKPATSGGSSACSADRDTPGSSKTAVGEPSTNLEIYDQGWSSWVDMKEWGPASRWLRSLIRDACRGVPAEVASIHDVGCGEGSNTRLLWELFPHAVVMGSDFSSTAIDVSERHQRPPYLTFRHDPNGDLIDHAVDMTTCFEVLEHVDDWEPLLERMSRSTRRFLLISTPTGRMRPFERGVGHVRNFRRGEIEGFLARLGWKPLSIAYAGFPCYSPIYRDLCQLTNAGNAEFTKGRFGRGKRVLSTVLYWSFRYCSTRRRHGDQFVGLFCRDAPVG